MCLWILLTFGWVVLGFMLKMPLTLGRITVISSLIMEKGLRWLCVDSSGPHQRKEISFRSCFVKEKLTGCIVCLT